MTRSELIAALEKATGPDEDLDNAIADGLRVRGWCFDDEGLKKEMFSAEPYTASIDAALTLVPEGYRVSQMGEWDHPHLRARGTWYCILKQENAADLSDETFVTRCQNGPTPAIAICIAALKAREATDDQN